LHAASNVRESKTSVSLSSLTNVQKNKRDPEMFANAIRENEQISEIVQENRK